MTRRLRFGEYECDLRSGELFEGGRTLRLPEQPMTVLAALLERPGDVITREELRRRLWDGDTFVDYDVGLNKAVARLREALNDHAGAPRFIETLPKRGYRWISDVVPVNGNGHNGAHPPDAVAVTEEGDLFASKGAALSDSSSRPRLWVLGSILIVAVLALSSVFVADWVRGRLGRQRLSLPVKAMQPKTDRLIVVAVSEFVCEECKEPQEADALRAETIAALGRLKATHLTFVTPRTGQTTTAVADYVLDGVVTCLTTKVRVTSRLVRVSDSTQVWTEAIEAAADGEHPAIARKIARATRLALAPLEMPERLTIRSRSAEARDEYLKGLYLQSRQGQPADAAAHFERATMLDPQLSDAWAGLALSQTYLRPVIVQTKAIASAQRALALNPRNAEAWIALGYAHILLEWNWPEAEKALRKARELEPRNARAAIGYATYLATIGKLNEAIALGHEAARLDPLSPLTAQILGRFYYFNHQPQLAMYEWARSLQIDPDFFWSNLFLSFHYEDLRAYDQWYIHFRRARVGASEAQLVRLDSAAASIGTAAFCERVFEERVREAEAGRGEAGSIAIGYARRGQTEKALDWIDIALERKGIDMTYLKIEPAYDGLRSHPRFQAALAKLKIP